MSAVGWAQFDVEADVGIRGWGPTRAEAFAQAALGVFALLVGPDQVQAREQREVRAQAEEPQALLVAWIDECLYVHEIEGFVARSVEMGVCSDTLAHGMLLGEPVAPDRHRLGSVVRGAMYHWTAVEGRGGYHEVSVVMGL
jgi:tRNA nucleotidyltransferase (CCA-adding enzyme)